MRFVGTWITHLMACGSSRQMIACSSIDSTEAQDGTREQLAGDSPLSISSPPNFSHYPAKKIISRLKIREAASTTTEVTSPHKTTIKMSSRPGQRPKNNNKKKRGKSIRLALLLDTPVPARPSQSSAMSSYLTEEKQVPRSTPGPPGEKLLPASTTTAP